MRRATLTVRGDDMGSRCPACGTSHKQGDQFCRKCGTRLRDRSGEEISRDLFEKDLAVLLENFKEIISWMGTEKRKSIRFMKVYKERVEGDLGAAVKAFVEKHGIREETPPPPLALLHEAFSALRRPIAFMETELRPSVGMGVFLERWMMRDVVERYLKDCCEEAERHLEALEETMEPV